MLAAAVFGLLPTALERATPLSEVSLPSHHPVSNQEIFMNSDNSLPGSMHGLQATFYEGERPIFNENELTKLKDFYTVSQVDLDWGDSAPGADVPADRFSAVFEGKLVADQPGTQDYNLYLNTGADEGVRLYVGGKKVIDTWNDPTSRELSTTVSLTEDEAQDIRLEYKEGTGDAQLKLEWEADGVPRQVIPTENLVRHGYGNVDESDLLTLRVATDGSDNFEIIENPTDADYEAIQENTFASIQDAVDQAEALMNTGQGVKILVEPGDYRVSEYGNFGIVLGDQNARDTSQFDLNEKGREAALVIEGTGPGVRILGSEQWQDGWQHLGGGVYKHEWTQDWGFDIEVGLNTPTDPITHRREAVFVDGQRLDPVLFRETTFNTSSRDYSFGRRMNPVEDLESGQFAVDEDGDAIYMKLPQGKSINDTVEVAQAEQLFRAQEPNDNLVLRNLEFSHAANRYARDYAFGAVDIGGANWQSEERRSGNIVIDNVSVEDNSGTGLRLRSSDNVTVKDSTFNNNGTSGISTRRLDGVLMHNVDAEYNNWRGELGGYRGWFVGGIKNHYIENVTADGFNASNNYTHGYWHDLNAKNTLFVNGITENNSRNGIFIEVSDGPHQVVDSISRNNGQSGVMINTSPNVLVQGNRISNNGGGDVPQGNNPTDTTDNIDGEIRVGARIDREANESKLPDIVDNVTLIDNIVQNTSDDTTNELIALYANNERYQDLLENELVANQNVYWDATGEAAFAQRYNRNLQFSEAAENGDRWLDVSNREDFEAGSVFERPRTGTAQPTYRGSFAASLSQGEDIVLTSEQLAVQDPDTYAFDLEYRINSTPDQGTLRLRGVSLSEGDSFTLADVERGWVSYTHEASNQTDDSVRLQVSDGTHELAARNLSLTIDGRDQSSNSSGRSQPQDRTVEDRSSDLPSEGRSRNLPGEDKSRNLPGEDKSSDLPSEGRSRNLPGEDKPGDIVGEDKSAGSTSAPRGLVAELTMNEGNGERAADSSDRSRNNRGTLVGDAEWTKGLQKGAVAFDGEGDAIHLRDSRSINEGIHQERTLSLWFRADDLTNPSGQKQVIYEEGARARGLNVYLEGNQLYVGGWNTAQSESGWQGTWLSTDDFAANEWNHVALVLDGDDSVKEGALRGYINGEQFGEGRGSQLWEHTGDIGLGSINEGTRFHDGAASSGHGLTGAIDQVEIFNNALSDNQIQTLAEPI